MIYSDFEKEDELTDIMESTFNLCNSNKDEIRWLITFLRGCMNIPHKRNETHIENYKLNLWQYEMYPILQKYRKKWRL